MTQQPNISPRVRPIREADSENDMEEPSRKRVKLETLQNVDAKNGDASENKSSPRKSRKPAHPVHFATHQDNQRGSTESKLVFNMDKTERHETTLIQRLAKRVPPYHSVLSGQMSEEDGVDEEDAPVKVENEGGRDVQQRISMQPQSPAASNVKQQDAAGNDQFAALHDVADAAVALLSQGNETSDMQGVLESLQSGEHNFAALIAASEGLLSMKAMAEEPASEQNDGEPADDDVAAYPAPRLVRPPRPQWSWSYVDSAAHAEPLPSWGTRTCRTSGDGRVEALLKNGPDEFYKEKDAKIRKQENSLKDRDRQIAKLHLQMKSERKHRDKRISELESELKKQQLLEKQQEDDLAKLKAEIILRKDEVRQQHSQIKVLKQELTQVHRRESDAQAQASDVQEELQKLQGEAKAASTYKQELAKSQADVAKLQRELDRQAAEARALTRTIKSLTKERDGLLHKLTEMAEQVRLFTSLKERSSKMERIISEITRRSDELRTSTKESDLEAFHTLKEIVAESVKLGVNNGETVGTPASTLMDLLTGEGDKGRNSKDATLSELVVKEEEVQSLKNQCRSYAEALHSMEQKLEEVTKANTVVIKPGVWKARVPGGQTGEYDTYRMRSNAQVELPEGTLLSVPRSANMQSSSNSLLTKVHEGDLLNFMEVDMSSLSSAELGVATRQLLSMDMSALQAPDLSALLKKLGQVDVTPVNRDDVRGLAGKLLNVLGVDDSIALFEYFMHNMPQSGMMSNSKQRPSLKSDMNDRGGTDASPKLYSTQLSGRRANMSMPSGNASNRRDLNAAPMQSGGARSLQSHHLSSSHHSSMGHPAGNDSRSRDHDSRSRDHDSREPLSHRSMMSRQGNTRNGGPGDIPSQLAAQAMIGSTPLSFSSAMMSGGSQQQSGALNMPKNSMRRALPNTVTLAANPGGMTQAQLASLMAGGGSPNVLSIPITQLNQLTQLGGMPVTIVPGLTQLVHMPPNTNVQKPR